MVNTINTFGIVPRNNRNSVTDMNSINHLRQGAQCGVDNHSYYIDQSMFSPASCEYQGQQITAQSPIIPPKPSPSYMDNDVQFNYPDVRPSYPNNFHGQVTQKMPCQKIGSDPELFVLDRQYSLTTVMEVIDNHVIDDEASYSFGSCEQTDRNVNTQTIQPQDVRFNPQGFLTKSKPQLTVLAPPASDMREDKLASNAYGSSVSSSPGGMNLPPYQEDFIQSPVSSYSTFNQQSSTSTNYNSEAYTSTVLQATQDVASPYQDQSYEYQYDVETPPYLQNENDPNYNDVFLNDNNQFPSSNQPSSYDSTLPSLIPNTSSSRSNINTSSYSSPSSSIAPLHPVQTPSQALVEHSFQSSHQPSTYPSLSSSMDAVHYPQPSPQPWPNNDQVLAIAAGGAKYELEEIHEFDEDLTPEDLSRRKQDIKRIRNNKACRDSRQRRKKRKLDREKLAQNLEVENHMLKEKIRRLEKEVKLTYKEVQRRTTKS